MSGASAGMVIGGTSAGGTDAEGIGAAELGTVVGVVAEALGPGDVSG